MNSNSTPRYFLTRLDEKQLGHTGSIITISKTPDDASPLLIDKLNYKDIFEFYINISNVDFAEKQRYALITLVNSKQVKINNKDVHFIEVEKGKSINLLSYMRFPKSNDIYNITSILVLNPFENINKYNNSIFTSVRVGLEIRK